MSEIGVFTPEQARLLWHDYLARNQLPAQLQKHYPQRRTPDIVSPHRVHIQNLSGEAVPAFGCMQITGTADIGAKTALTIDKPTSTDGQYIFNGPYIIEDTETGWGYRHGVVLMLGDAPYISGSQYLPIVGSWEIEEGAGPFVVYGPDQTGERTIVGRIQASGGGGVLIEGPVADTVCAAGTLDIAVDFASTCSEFEDGEVINVVDRLGIMGGHISSEFVGLLAVAVRLYNLSTCQEEYRLVLLNGHGECPTYG